MRIRTMNFGVGLNYNPLELEMTVNKTGLVNSCSY